MSPERKGKWFFSGRETDDITASFHLMDAEGNLSADPDQKITLGWDAYQYFVQGALAKGHEVDDSRIRSVFYDPGYG